MQCNDEKPLEAAEKVEKIGKGLQPLVNSCKETKYRRDKELALRIMMLLSALESWSFVDKHKLPDYMSDEISEVIETLRKEVLK